MGILSIKKQKKGTNEINARVGFILSLAASEQVKVRWTMK